MNPKTLCDQYTKEQLAERVVELEAENKRLLELLDAAYVLQFVDDTASRQQQMDFWTEVEKTIAV